MLTQLKISFLFSTLNLFNTSADASFYFHASLISGINRDGGLQHPLTSQLAILTTKGGWYWSPDLGASLQRTRAPLPKNTWISMRPCVRNDLHGGAACRPLLTSPSPRPLFRRSLYVAIGEKFDTQFIGAGASPRNTHQLKHSHMNSPYAWKTLPVFRLQPEPPSAVSAHLFVCARNTFRWDQYHSGWRPNTTVVHQSVMPPPPPHPLTVTMNRALWC